MTSGRRAAEWPAPEEWCDDTAVDLSQERLEIVERARERARAKRLHRRPPDPVEPESAVVRKADKLPEL